MSEPMKILLVDGFAGDDPIVAEAIATLSAAGHHVDHLDLDAVDFTVAMSTEERRRYHDEGENLLASETRDAAALLAACDGLLFCMPQVTYTVPARVKGFLDRVFIPGVAFGFDNAGRVAPKLRQIRRLGLITRGPHGRGSVMRARNGAGRTVLWTVRLNCSWTCRRTHVALPPGESVGGVAARLGRW